MSTAPKLHLKSLNIQNFATFENQVISFDDKFNAIIGETGSGKSLILDALQLIFGQRSDKKLIRKGATFASIEAIFQVDGNSISSYFDDIGHPYEDDEIVVKRIVYSTGKSKSFLNFQQCPLTTLSNFSKRFIDLVGQFENQKLLSEDYQLVLIDSFAGNEELLNSYKSFFSRITDLSKQIDHLTGLQMEKDQREDYIKFQIAELEELNPSIEDEEETSRKKDELLNLNSTKQTVSELINLLSDNDTGNVLGMLRSSISLLENAPLSSSSQGLEKLHEANSMIEEVSFELSKHLDDEFDEQEFENIIDRLDRYQQLKRKFGGSIESLIDHYDQFKNELAELSKIDQELSALIELRTELISDAQRIAFELHDSRLQAASTLSVELTEGIRELRMQGATISIELETVDTLGPTGISRIKFLAETNHGEGFFKVKDVASGGELSRILLSMRQILSSRDSISVFLFDEIDTGIGGETAVCSGRALEKVSRNSQVIAITHLPQIAFFADKLINVSKHITDIGDTKRTFSKIDEIDGEGKNEFIKAMTPI